MQHDRLEPAFEVEQEKVAHEIEARREGHEIALERRVERILLHERIAPWRVAKRFRHALRQLLGPPRRAVDRHEASVEVGRVERKAKRAARSLKLTRQRVAFEVHEEDHVVSGGERPSAEVEIFELLESWSDDQHVRIDGDDPLKMSGQDFVKEQAAEHRTGKAPFAGELGVEAQEVESHELDAIAQWRQQPVETRRHVVWLAYEKNLALYVWFGLHHGCDRAHSRRKERPVRRETISGSHGVLGWPL